MRLPTHNSRCRRPRSPAGFSIVELMVALAIALFLIGGMLTILQNVRNTYSDQTKLAQLQDSERLAMTLISNVVQSAGYFPNPYANATSAALPASPSFGAAASGTPPGPVIFGVANANPQGDTIAVRYAAGNTDQIMNCTGQTNTTVAPYVSWENDFAVDAAGELTCAVWDSKSKTTTAPVAIVTGITNMTILYGVQTNPLGNGTCTDTYMNATQVSAAGDWGKVCSVRVTLTFTNPIPNTGAVTFTRTIAIMSQGGVV